MMNLQRWEPAPDVGYYAVLLWLMSQGYRV